MKNLNINIKITNDIINDVNLKCAKLQENYNAQTKAIIEYRELQRIENENRQSEIQKREAAIKIQVCLLLLIYLINILSSELKTHI